MVGMSALGLPLAGPSAAHAGESPATLHVLLPADATLTVDGHPTRSLTSDRWFISPPLEEGRDFHYDLRAQFPHGGEVVTVERTVTVRAGEETTVRLESPTATPAAFEEGQPGVVSRSFYYSPDAGQPGAASRPFSPAAFGQPGTAYRAFYYSPPATPVPDFSAPYLFDGRPSGGVGGARTNWKPDFSDRFLMGDNW
jgi:uncharacterized protein (TIGR03000 family)